MPTLAAINRLVESRRPHPNPLPCAGEGIGYLSPGSLVATGSSRVMYQTRKGPGINSRGLWCERGRGKTRSRVLCRVLSSPR